MQKLVPNSYNRYWNRYYYSECDKDDVAFLFFLNSKPDSFLGSKYNVNSTQLKCSTKALIFPCFGLEGGSLQEEQPDSDSTPLHITRVPVRTVIQG